MLTVLQNNALDPARNYGPIHGFPKTVATATLNTEIARLRGEILDSVPTPTTPTNLGGLIDAAIRTAFRSRHDELPAGPWSAAMVSTCVRRAAIAATIEYMAGGRHLGRDEPLLLAGKHLDFTKEAYRRKRAQTRGTYHAFMPAEREPQVGDIIVQDRQATTVGGVITLANIPAIGGRNLHSDIIVEANATDDFVIAIGGNVGHSVRRRRYPLTADRRLLVQPQSLYTQEDDSQNLPNLPQSSTAALEKSSTARIFALLCPVETCIIVPGTRVNGDVIA